MSFAEGTSVPVTRTKAEIEALVSKYGATRFASGWDKDNKAAISFALHGRLVRFVLQLVDDEAAKKKAPKRSNWSPPAEGVWRKWKDAENRRLWRCLLLAIKAKLEVVASGISAFDEEFLAHIVTAENVTVYEAMKLQPNGIRLLEAVK